MPKQELQSDENYFVVDGERVPKFELNRADSPKGHYFPYRCLGEQILVQRIDSETETTAGGVVKPEIARLKSNRGIVMAVGEGRIVGNEFQPFNLRPGQVVRFSRVGGQDIEVDGQNFILLHWKQVYLVESV